jgi:hypothetical protein
MRADTQRKPLGFQEVTASHYRCVSICVIRLTGSQQILALSLVLKTKGFLEQPSSTSLLQTVSLAPCYKSGWIKANHPPIINRTKLIR